MGISNNSRRLKLRRGGYRTIQGDQNLGYGYIEQFKEIRTKERGNRTIIQGDQNQGEGNIEHF